MKNLKQKSTTKGCDSQFVIKRPDKIKDLKDFEKINSDKEKEKFVKRKINDNKEFIL